MGKGIEYAELKCKTNFSFLRGASHPEELVSRAVELGLKGLALNDKDGVYGIPKAYHYSRSHPDFKFIVGADLTLKDHPSLTLLAKDRQAYGLLCRMITASHADKPKGEACLTLSELASFMNERDDQGLLALPDGVALEVPSAKTDWHLFKELFNKNLYLPLSRFHDGKDKERTEKTVMLSKCFDIPIVATNDVHYHLISRSRLQDALTSIRHSTSLNDAGFRLFSNGERYLKSPEMMNLLFKDMPEAITQTLQIAEQCIFSPSELRYRYPSEWIPKNHTAQSYLEERVWEEGAGRYKGEIPDAVIKQLKDELSLIKQLQYADYFLTIYEIVCFARSKKILCQGRGAAANSAVCFVLGITAIDPVKMNLLFERFMSVERSEPPDIDVDFEHERREEVIQHIYEKYGRNRAAMVSAVVTYKKRSAFREMSKALGIDVGTLSAKKIERNFENLAAKTKNKQKTRK
jgi:error-prone DNA polymerase